MTQPLGDKDRWLAAEFAMGVLGRKDMRLAEKRFDEDPSFRQAVEEWQHQLTPMLKEVKSVQPAPAVWEGIANKTFAAYSNDESGLWSSLTFWRGLSAFTGSLAAACIAALLFFPGLGLLIERETATPLVATLTATGEAPAFLARFDPESGALVIKAAVNDPTETRVAELWLIPGDGVPRSLGLLDDDGKGQLQVSKENLAVFGGGGTLAVSLEPAGGSPTGAPTGPVIASGKLQPI